MDIGRSVDIKSHRHNCAAPLPAGCLCARRRLDVAADCIRESCAAAWLGGLFYFGQMWRWCDALNLFKSYLGGGFYLGKWSKLTNIFQMGWNHQLVIILCLLVESLFRLVRWCWPCHPCWSYHFWIPFATFCCPLCCWSLCRWCCPQQMCLLWRSWASQEHDDLGVAKCWNAMNRVKRVRRDVRKPKSGRNTRGYICAHK